MQVKSQEKMQEKIKKLTELQYIDSKLSSIEKSKGNLPYIVNELTDEIFQINAEVSALEGVKTNLENSLKESKSTIESSKIMLEKYKTQRSMVTNNKEYEALIKEIEYREGLVLEEEQNIKNISESILKNNSDLEVKIKIVTEKDQILKEKQTQLEDKLSETSEEQKILEEKRNNLVAKTDKHLYNLYERIYGSKGHVAVVPANEGHCGGCFTILPSQKLSELKRADSIVQCDACSRILFYEIKDAN
jgi:predicted  nucleic acid-binding Zn-ribbon protein